MKYIVGAYLATISYMGFAQNEGYSNTISGLLDTKTVQTYWDGTILEPSKAGGCFIMKMERKRK